MSQTIQCIKICQFDDDGAVWAENRNPKLAVKKNQNVLSTIENWSQETGMQTNPNKTQVVVFHKPNIKPPGLKPEFPKLTLCAVQQTYSPTTKVLGMTFGKTITWAAHISALVQKCEKDLNIVRAIRGKLGNSHTITF